MNTGGEAAEQIVRMSLEGFEVAAKITGAGAKNIAILLYSILKEEKKTKGKARLNLNFSKKFRLEVHIMAYNKAREEKKWRLWKEAEEKQLRSLGVSEDTIEQLRVHDWAIFNSDRRYYQRMQEAGTYLDEVAEDTTPPEIKTVEDFLDNIENQQLYQVLIKVDRLTLQAVLLQLQGFSIAEIALMLDMKEYTVYKRLSRLKEKIKKLLG